MTTYYVSIGNSDDKLSQQNWARFQASVLNTIRTHADEIHGEWFSTPTSGYQNMCICYEASTLERQGHIRSDLRNLAQLFNQDSIALARALTEFIK